MATDGIDVASFQAVPLVETLVNRIGFGIVKATQGTGYVNPIHSEQLRLLAHHGKPIGAYHFLEPGEPALAQWKHFEAHLAPWKGGLIVAVDHEANEHGETPSAKLAGQFIRAGESRGWQVGRYGSAAQTMAYVAGEAWRWVALWADTPPRVQWDIWQQRGDGTVDRDQHRLAGSAFHQWWLRHAYHHRRRIIRRHSGGRPHV